MASVNKVFLIGRLGGDPEIKYTPSGTAHANFSLATEDTWTGKDDKKESKTQWHKVEAWGRLAEICGEYLQKGSQLYVEGRIDYQTWEKDGEKKYMTKIIMGSMQMLGGKGEGKKEDRGAQYRQSAQDEGSQMSDNSDIPF